MVGEGRRRAGVWVALRSNQPKRAVSDDSGVSDVVLSTPAPVPLVCVPGVECCIIVSVVCAGPLIVGPKVDRRGPVRYTSRVARVFFIH